MQGSGEARQARVLPQVLWSKVRREPNKRTRGW